MVISTRQGKEDALQHIITVLFSAEPDGDIAKALKHDKLVDPINLVATSALDLSQLYFINAAGDQERLTKSQGGMLQSFKRHCYKLQQDNGTELDDIDFENIEPADFNRFRIHPDNEPTLTPTLTAPQPGTTSDRVSEFRRQSKRNVRLFTNFEDEAQWDNFKRDFEAQIDTQGLADVLDSQHRPTTPEDKALLQEQNKFVCAAFVKIRRTNQGKTLVRENKNNARVIWTALCTHQNNSTKADLDAEALLTHITSSKINDGSWKGTTHTHILNWLNQSRLHASVSAHKFPTGMLCTMLENAVSLIREFRIISNTASQLRDGGGKALLKSAALQFDHHSSLAGNRNRRRPSRQVYIHDIEHDVDHFNDPDTF